MISSKLSFYKKKPKKLNTTEITFNFKGQNISAKEEVDLLGITIDDKFTFETHISRLCRKTERETECSETTQLLYLILSNLILSYLSLSNLI